MTQRDDGPLMITNGRVLRGTGIDEVASQEDIVVENGMIIAIGPNAADEYRNLEMGVSTSLNHPPQVVV